MNLTHAHSASGGPGALAPPAVLALVQRFAEQEQVYRRPDYKELRLRDDFLNPFFVALGWDVANTKGYAEAYRDVHIEPAIKVGSLTKSPDYAFRVGGVRKFFVEAKKPSVDLVKDPKPAYQLRRYAWSAKLPLSILTDFEELTVYDCRFKPEPSDKASVARVMAFHYSEYADRWPELAAIFSHEAILKGAFDRYADSTKAKRGTAAVDDAFLADLEAWREALAKHIALRNPGLSVAALNEAVQKTLDRIIFLRIGEDRAIEPYGQLQGLLNGQNVYARLAELFDRADLRYNSGLFHFHTEKDRATKPDDWTLALRIDDKPLKDILKRLYYPDSPYEFSVVPADLLGHVYERFLGKVIRLTSGNRAVVEEKPEVRKAGGVYYTPTFVVDYIVRHTIGPLLRAKNPAEAADLKILDPACGSGSFLLGAYQHLLDWHLDWYIGHNPAKFKAAVRPTPDGGWALTTAERKRILTENIFGVDIDAQAVEVTKLSLMLKVLEGESAESLGGQMRLVQERALPDLDRNIQCGNSLIGPDVYQGRQLTLIDDDTTRRINAFDWQAAFPAIMRRGGFDAVIGNPPYIRIQALREWAPLEVDFYKQHYQSASKGNYDIYVVFVERALQLLNPNGHHGFILPHKFFNAQYGQPLRDLLAAGRHLRQVVHFGDQQVFNQATTYTCLLFLTKAGSESVHVTKVSDLAAWRAANEVARTSASSGASTDTPSAGAAADSGDIAADRITAAEWNFVVSKGADLFERLREMPVKLGDVADIFVGLQTSADAVYILSTVGDDGGFLRLNSAIEGTEVLLEPNLLRPLVSGVDIYRYREPTKRQYVIFPYQFKDGKSRLIPFSDLTQDSPMTAGYLSRNRRVLEARESFRMKTPEWYGYVYRKNLDRQPLPKVCVPRLVTRLYASLDVHGEFFLDNVDVGGVVWKAPTELHTLPYLLGLFNSRLVGWYFPNVSAPFRGGFRSANKQFLSQLPIRTIDPASPTDVRLHDDVVALVQRMLDLHKRLAVEKSSHDRTLVQRQIEATDQAIDRLVYALYGLTAAEVAIVEGRA